MMTSSCVLRLYRLVLFATTTLSVSCGTFAADLLVYNTNDEGAGSLRQAISDNNALGGGNRVLFSNVVSGTIMLTNGYLFVSKSATILGPGANLLSLNGNGSSWVFFVSNAPAVTISGVTVTGGYGSIYGGGILNYAGSQLTVSNCAIINNTANFGAGIENEAVLTLLCSTLSSNTAIEGGALDCMGTAAITNCTFSGNSAQDGGAGIYLSAGSASLVSSTFSGNTSSTAEGGGNIYMRSGTTLRIGNTILDAGPSGTNIYNGGTITSLGYNLCTDGGGGRLTGVGDQVRTPANLGPLQDNGGPTLTMRPLPASLALDQGNSFGALLDQRGLPRTWDNPAIPNAAAGDGTDIGAVEFNSHTLVVSNTADAGPGSLRQAVLNTGPDGADTITFAPGVSGTISLSSGELDITNGVLLAGPGAGVISVDGEGTNIVFRVLNCTASISDLTLTNGTDGILNVGTLSVSNCLVRGHHAFGISNERSLTLNNCTVCDNIRTNNSIRGGDGGGIFNNGSSTTLLMTNCTVSGNLLVSALGAPAGGAGINVSTYSNLAIINCTVCSNSCTALEGSPSLRGAGILVSQGTNGSIGNTLVAANTTSGPQGPVGYPDIYAPGTITSAGYNLIGATNGSTGWGAAGEQLGSTNSPINPVLGPLQANGSPLLTHAPLAGSPVIDKGKRVGAATDERGAHRPFDFPSIANANGGDGSDIGALEYTPGRPQLSLAVFGTSAVLSWSTNDFGFTLESASALPANSWSPVPGTLTVSGTQYLLTNAPVNGTRFFRLRAP